MSRTIVVDGSANLSFIVSDAEYASIDWGANSDDVVSFVLENGGSATLTWAKIGAVFAAGAVPPPGSYPGWRVTARGPYGAVEGLHVNDATKAAIEAALVDADVILEFTTLQGSDVKMPSINATAITLNPGDYVVPE